VLRPALGVLRQGERFRGRLYDAPHEFNAQMRQETWDWLARWL
jgi:hypothetical protein